MNVYKIRNYAYGCKVTCLINGQDVGHKRADYYARKPRGEQIERFTFEGY